MSSSLVAKRIEPELNTTDPDGAVYRTASASTWFGGLASKRIVVPGCAQLVTSVSYS